MNKIAQKWADHLAKHDEFAHSKPAQRQHKGDQMGENIAMKFTSDNQPYTGKRGYTYIYSLITWGGSRQGRIQGAGVQGARLIFSEIKPIFNKKFPLPEAAPTILQ